MVCITALLSRINVSATGIIRCPARVILCHNNIPYMRKFSPGEHFCQFRQCMPLAKVFSANFLHSENFDTFVHAHTYAHSNSQAPPTTSWKVTRAIGKIKFGEIFVPVYSMSLWQKFSQWKFYHSRLKFLSYMVHHHFYLEHSPI